MRRAIFEAPPGAVLLLLLLLPVPARHRRASVRRSSHALPPATRLLRLRPHSQKQSIMGKSSLDHSDGGGDAWRSRHKRRRCRVLTTSAALERPVLSVECLVELDGAGVLGNEFSDAMHLYREHFSGPKVRHASLDRSRLGDRVAGRSVVDRCAVPCRLRRNLLGTTLRYW
jgi:hypothetical protein